jgi:hypothetical protein
MTQEQEKPDGTVTVSTLDNQRDTSRLCVRCGNPSGIEVTYRSSLTDTISTTILSLGVASALILFVELSFAHPDAANVLIPLVLVPILRYLAIRFKLSKFREHEEQAKK